MLRVYKEVWRINKNIYPASTRLGNVSITAREATANINESSSRSLTRKEHEGQKQTHSEQEKGTVPEVNANEGKSACVLFYRTLKLFSRLALNIIFCPTPKDCGDLLSHDQMCCCHLQARGDNI